ncbi:glycoside hydrolase family 127 protein [Wenyingzhuangia aestuarii]|uniref:glycoside hydrolase family 127 protein n=1 Tax=Wenyingzhuangia aestuarii TaxID=1647582 RepID=UPI00143C6EAE|nr:beta-L-arabinofuranosidase domain-containing protein [Wenyingzhuangia aestuarii]NJB83033.1 hypothetical protein [Wenyingzhuangia aestuarii]
MKFINISFFCVLLVVLTTKTTTAQKLHLNSNKGIINNINSPNMKFKSIDIGDCKWTEGFWADKYKNAEEVMVPHMEEILTGDVGFALDNFKIAAGLKKGKHQGMHWHDGDFYKWMEAAMYVYANNKDAKILERLESYIEIIGKAQEESGYLHTEISIDDNLEPYQERRFHEMYNSGHLYIAASIYYRITGKTNFLKIAIKNADNLYKIFSPQPEELARFGFNQVQITGLVELYRTTNEKKYLELAQLFIDMRGKSKVKPHKTVRFNMIGDMTQERTPFREEKEAVGHAVLGLYMYTGAADVYAETGEKALINTLDRIWGNIVEKKMFITGACGQAHDGGSSHRDFVHEAFTLDYQMHNSNSYNETCANLCNAMFNYRMLSIKGESKYADIIETVMYNSALSGIDIKGENYFYTNPLRRSFDQHLGGTDYKTRQPYIPCFCCPPNLVRTIAKLSAWAYNLSSNGVVVNLFGGNKLDTRLLDGTKLKLFQTTNYPWEGNVSIKIEKCKKTAFDIFIRVPQWANGTKILVNGKEISQTISVGSYAVLNRKWKKGDVISLDLPMNVKLYTGHRRIEETRNQVAIKRGPVVYCVETADLPAKTDVLDVYIPSKIKLESVYESSLLGGVTTLNGNVKLKRSTRENIMYPNIEGTTWETYKAKFIPYYSWSNRGEGEMTVFMSLIWE